MSAMRHFARLALRPVVEGVCDAVGASVVSGAAGAAADFLVERFTDQSEQLHQKLEVAIGRTWTTLEVALAGESFWDKCRVLVSLQRSRCNTATETLCTRSLPCGCRRFTPAVALQRQNLR